MRSYDNNHKMTEIETLNCGQSDGLMSSGASQYVDGPVAYLDTKMNEEPNLIDPHTPGRRVVQANSKGIAAESFYSTPCPPGHGKGNPAGYIITDKSMGPYITATLRKQGQGSGAQCTSVNIALDPRSEAIYGELMNRSQTAGTSHQQQQQQQQQVQFNTHHGSHPYYTHSLITTNAPGNHPEGGNHAKLVSREQSDHVYELPKQQQLNQQFDPKVS